MDAKLCYVCPDDTWAYFTTAPLSVQWGDDWDDAPYEHNAGVPYTWMPYMGPVYEILVVAFDPEGLAMPCDGWLNSPHSVRDINQGAMPWLRAEEGPVVRAGTSVATFLRAMRDHGRPVSWPVPVSWASQGRVCRQQLLEATSRADAEGAADTAVALAPTWTGTFDQLVDTAIALTEETAA